ncbi:Guanine nucleotide exchange factor VAV3 [Liparis tanakae]|uniref:Guanine nucleotide exchange factor VAV3 n=1 Tax=Liparis tanakae TaxID=230148 RepID=A0A4Z2I460_9TELE|nr:Guanine nucleotide exchange factor VAV3 [Liparis tanakae]
MKSVRSFTPVFGLQPIDERLLSMRCVELSVNELAWDAGLTVRVGREEQLCPSRENGVEDEEDLYDCVYDDEDGGEIYEDLMKTEAVPPPAFQKHAETDIRSCCLSEIKQTEEKYTETLESIEKHFMTPLTMFLSMAEMEKVFVNIPVSHCFHMVTIQPGGQLKVTEVFIEGLFSHVDMSQ